MRHKLETIILRWKFRWLYQDVYFQVNLTRLTPCRKIWLPCVVDNLRQECSYKFLEHSFIVWYKVTLWISHKTKAPGCDDLDSFFLLLTDCCYPRLNLSTIQPPKWRCWNHEASPMQLGICLTYICVALPKVAKASRAGGITGQNRTSPACK